MHRELNKEKVTETNIPAILVERNNRNEKKKEDSDIRSGDSVETRGKHRESFRNSKASPGNFSPG